MRATNVCMSSNASFLDRPWLNGPTPLSVPAIAVIDRKDIAVAVSRGPKRKAAHSRTGINTNAGAPKIGELPPNTDPATTSSVMTNRMVSMRF
jgi:hypothetical protein